VRGARPCYLDSSDALLVVRLVGAAIQTINKQFLHIAISNGTNLGGILGYDRLIEDLIEVDHIAPFGFQSLLLGLSQSISVGILSAEIALVLFLKALHFISTCLQVMDVISECLLLNLGILGFI
jgi:hypothetical protein